MHVINTQTNPQKKGNPKKKIVKLCWRLMGEI